jgi:COP9 signalosome complex subunit 7
VRATSAPNTFIFTELLQTPHIQALGSSEEFAPYLTVLQIFSHGTYATYTSTAALPELNDAQRLKLRQLSLLTLAKKDSNSSNPGSSALDYAALQTALDLPSRQALEELVISAIYAGLIKGQLNPKASHVQINSVSPLRDVAPTAISGLLSSLQAWAGRCEATLESLSCQMTQLRADADRRAARTAARTRDMEMLVEKEKGGQAPRHHHHLSIPSPTTAANASPLRSKSTRNIHNPYNHSHTHNAGPALHRDNNRSGDGGGGSGSNKNTTSTTTNTTTNSEMNNVLTVGGGSRFHTPGVSEPTTGPADNGGTARLQVRAAKKRGSEQMDGDGNEDSMDEDGMGASDEDDGGGMGE